MTIIKELCMEYYKQCLQQYTIDAQYFENADECPICHGTGIVEYQDQDGFLRGKICKCQVEESEREYLKKSGLADQIERYTFDNFNPGTECQKMLLNSAKNFAANPSGWFFVGGQSGSGKTHICTAIVRELIKTQNVTVRQMRWQDDSIKLKSSAMDNFDYWRMFEKFSKPNRLFIDDFLHGELKPADTRLAFQLIEARYENSNTITIINSEKSLEEIYKEDEAIGGRIIERCGENVFTLENSNFNDHRLLKSMIPLSD